MFTIYFSIIFDIFFAIFLLSIMFLNFFLSVFNRTIALGHSLFLLGLFVLLQRLPFFSYLLPVFLSFFNSFINFFFFFIIKHVNFYRLLFNNKQFISFKRVILRIFTWLFKLFFVLINFLKRWNVLLKSKPLLQLNNKHQGKRALSKSSWNNLEIYSGQWKKL